MHIKIEKTLMPKAKPEGPLGFGQIFTDHMFIVDYTKGIGWHDARVVPYAPIALDPAALVLHYAQENFEGLKAYRTKDDKIQLFRPYDNARRMQSSCERLCMPIIDEEDWVQAVKTLVNVDRDWVPIEFGTSLYIRPFIIGIDAHLGVRASYKYQFIIILSPVAAYYPTGIDPVKIYVETQYVRAVRGGTGYTKAGANYAVSIKAQEDAKAVGYAQVLWLDGVERKYIEEVGAMNIFFVLDGKVVTPKLEGSVLPGITRRSCIEILKDWGYAVEERKLSIDEVEKMADEGKLNEAFGTGTAAVISPVGELKIGDKIVNVNNGEIGPISQKLYDTLTGIQWGVAEDTRNWTMEI